MWDKTKMNMNVNMTGKEYIAYRESKRIKIPKNVKVSLIYFSMALCGIIFIGLLIQDLTYVSPTDTFIQGWYEAMPLMVTQSWESIAKFTFLAFGPFIIVVMGLAWLFHGFGFLIFKG